ncbi:RcnB family protein [Phenylobacterium ferrooxidans]|uniref:RcnB family protein n=1 Tax=Phenylobacterium ferrooxidans TaxID=2982689 RepID=A0ABW6CV62_9CAUL
MKRAIAAALALSLLGGTAAMAQPAQYQRDYQGQYQQGYNGGRYDDRRDYRYDDRRDDRRGYGQQQRHYNGQAWRRGQRLPSQYRSSAYYVNDYGRYGLRAPPRGHRWVRANNDYVLAAIATGLIVQVLANSNSGHNGYNGYHR